MVQRVTLRTRKSYNTKSNGKRIVKTPGTSTFPFSRLDGKGACCTRAEEGNPQAGIMPQERGEPLLVEKNRQGAQNTSRGHHAGTDEHMTLQNRVQEGVECRSDCWECQEETMTPHRDGDKR